MPATVNAVKVLNGQNTTAVRATTASTAAANTSGDVLTINHGLGACPDILQAVLRCIRATVSNGSPAMVLNSWDATKAIFQQPANAAGATAADWDFVFQAIHTAVR